MMPKTEIKLEHVSCSLCNSQESRHLFYARDYIYGNEGEWPVAQCKNCGVVFMNPRIPPAKIGLFYPHSYYTNEMSPVATSGQSFKRAMKDCVIENYYGYTLADTYSLLNRFIGRLLFPFTTRWAVTNKYITPVTNGRVLDTGCGNGHMLTEYKRLGWETFGNEVGASSAQLARQAGHQIFVGELVDAIYEDNFFDAITLWDALEHIHNPYETLQEIYRITKPGGKIYISVPNYGSWYASRFKDKWFMFTAPLHYYHYTDETLSYLIRRVGFKEITIKYPLGDAGFQQTLNIVASKQRLLKTILEFVPVKAFLYYLNFFMPKGHLLAIANKS